MENTNNQNVGEQESQDLFLQDLFDILRNRIWIILAVAILCAAFAGVYSFYIAKPVYQSTAKLYMQAQDGSSTTLAELQAGSTLARDCVEMISSESISREVVDNLKLDMQVKQLQRSLTVSNPGDTRIINISVQSLDPGQAATIANEFARVSQERLSVIMKTDKPQLWEEAVASDKPIKPSKKRNVVLGFVLGFFGMWLIAIFRFIRNDSLKTPADIERYLELNVLATVPLFDAKKDKKRGLKKRKKTQK